MRTAYFLGVQALLLLAILSGTPAQAPNHPSGSAHAAGLSTPR